MRRRRGRWTGRLVMVVAIVTGGSTSDGVAWLVKVGDSSAQVRSPGGAWSRWVDGARRDLPCEIATIPSTMPPTFRTHAGATVWPLPGAHLVFRGRTIRLLRGGLVVRAGRGALRLAAATASVLIPAGRVRIRRDAGGGVLLLVEAGSIIHAGRSHRAGSALRWRAGRLPTLRPWPRGLAVTDASFVDGPSSVDEGFAPDTIETISFAEGSFRRALLGVCGEEPRRHRWLALALLIETGTPVERAAAAGLATGSEVKQLLHVLREATRDDDARVRRAARKALTRGHAAPLDQPAEDFLTDRRVCQLVRSMAARRARFEAKIASGGSAVLSILPRWRTHAALDVLACELRLASDGAVPWIIGILERVLGRCVDPEARARLGDRQAACLLLATVSRAFQPPGDDLLFP